MTTSLKLPNKLNKLRWFKLREGDAIPMMFKFKFGMWNLYLKLTKNVLIAMIYTFRVLTYLISN